MSSQIIFSQNAFSGAPVRENDLRYIINAIRHDKCCAVVAPSNMGKSKLLYSLQTEEVKSFCVGKDNKPVIMVFTDCLPIETETGFYQQILNDLVLKLESVVDRAGVPKQEININFPLRALTRLQKDANELMMIDDGKAALLLIDRALQRLLRQTYLKIVFIWDEFEQIFERLPGRTFKKFRAIRDTIGSRILCVLGLTRRLSRIRPDDALFEFREVFKMNTLVLRPLDRANSERFLHYVATSNDYNLDDELKDRIISLSGGHSGLMERILTLWARGEVSPEAKDMVEELCHDPRLKEECRRLWEELDQSERNVLLALAKQAPLSDTESLEYLLEAGILRKENGRYCVFSPVFARYIVKRIIKVIGDNIYTPQPHIGPRQKGKSPMKRIWLSLTLILLLALVLAACVSPNTESPPVQEQAPAATKAKEDDTLAEVMDIVTWYQYDQNNTYPASDERLGNEYLRSTIPQFNEAFKGKWNWVNQPKAFDKMTTELVAAVQAGENVPDIYEISNTQDLVDFYRHGTAQDMREWAEKESWWDDLHPAGITACTGPNGGFYCIPVRTEKASPAPSEPRFPPPAFPTGLFGYRYLNPLTAPGGKEYDKGNAEDMIDAIAAGDIYVSPYLPTERHKPGCGIDITGFVIPTGTRGCA